VGAAASQQVIMCTTICSITFRIIGIGVTNTPPEAFGMFNGGTYVTSATTGFFAMAVAPIPEPETYAMLLAGLGLIGFMARRRKQIS
jgi:hypothetical protein